MVSRFVSAIPDDARRNWLMAWFTKFGPIEFVNAEAMFRRGAKPLVGDAMTKPFWRLPIRAAEPRRTK
jgi:hypothetical protein